MTVNIAKDDKNDLSLKLHEQLRELYFSSDPFGLTEFLQGEMKVLSFIAVSYRELLPGQLSSALEMTAGRIAGILRSLEKKGYITRRTDIADRRRVLVSITEQGREYIDSSSEKLEQRLNMLVAEMGSENTVRVIESLKIYSEASAAVLAKLSDE